MNICTKHKQTRELMVPVNRVSEWVSECVRACVRACVLEWVSGWVKWMPYEKDNLQFGKLKHLSCHIIWISAVPHFLLGSRYVTEFGLYVVSFISRWLGYMRCSMRVNIYVAESTNEGLCYLLFLILYEHLEWCQFYTNTKTGHQEGKYN